MNSSNLKIIFIIILGVITTLSGGLGVVFFRMPQSTWIKTLEAISLLLAVGSLYGVVRLGFRKN